MAKDPAFLFYSKDWIEGTAEMMPDEKGIYIDLLCHQHQHGNIPSDTMRLSKIVRLSEPDFLKIWEHVKSKWIDAGNGRLINGKLNLVMTDRADKGHKNKIIGLFASLLRKYDLTKKEYTEARNWFKVDDFLPFPTEVATERLTERFTEWYEERSKSIGNENEDVLVLNTNKEKLEKRKDEFKKTLTPFKQKYGVEMLKSFFNYWSEPNRLFTKMKFELQETWDVSGRLATWASKDNNFKNNGEQKIVLPQRKSATFDE